MTQDKTTERGMPDEIWIKRGGHREGAYVNAVPIEGHATHYIRADLAQPQGDTSELVRQLEYYHECQAMGVCAVQAVHIEEAIRLLSQPKPVQDAISAESKAALERMKLWAEPYTECEEDYQTILAALNSLKAGYVLVPEDPTERMLEAGEGTFRTSYPREVYKAMIAAAKGGE